jgi:RNA polymerase sigma factor (sigma-70 family)
MNEDSAVTAFCESHYKMLVPALGLYCGDAWVAEELAQEALARAYRDWRKVQKCDNPTAWVYAVAFNLARSHFRRRAAERRALQRTVQAARPAQTDHQEVLELRTMVRSLPPRQRQATILRYQADLPVREIAQLMHCSEGTVKSHLHKALRRLRAELGREDRWEVPSAGTSTTGS